MPEPQDTAGRERECASLTMQRRRRRAVSAGLLISAIAVLALFGASELSLGTVQHPGPGAASDLLATLLFILGIVVAAEALVQRRIGRG